MPPITWTPQWLRAALTVRLPEIYARLGLLAPKRFLGPGDFQGGYSSATGLVSNGFQSTYDGTVVVTMIARTIVEKVLPSGVHLADPRVPPFTISARHPVIHLIGDQLEPSNVVVGNPIRIPGANGYREMILLVPFVVHDSGTQWHNYAVRMYLNDPTAVAGGNTVYGYAKVVAQLNKTEVPNQVTHKIKDLFGGTTFFDSEVQVTGPWVSVAGAAATPPRWADLKTIFEMPVLGVIGGFFVCSYWEWNFANAEVAPATSKHQVVTKFRNGMEDWETMGPLTNALDGAVSMRGVRWRLAPPLLGCQF